MVYILMAGQLGSPKTNEFRATWDKSPLEPEKVLLVWVSSKCAEMGSSVYTVKHTCSMSVLMEFQDV